MEAVKDDKNLLASFENIRNAHKKFYVSCIFQNNSISMLITYKMAL